jgi:hypothetical protein
VALWPDPEAGKVTPSDLAALRHDVLKRFKGTSLYNIERDFLQPSLIGEAIVTSLPDDDMIQHPDAEQSAPLD